MNVYVNVKSLGRRRPVLEKKSYSLPDSLKTLEDLIIAVVEQETDRYNEADPASIVPFLTEEVMAEQEASGKIGFGRRFSDKKANKKKAIENALQSYEDGIYKVFAGDDELTDLKAAIHLQEGNVLTFIRLTMLSGRLW